MILMLNLATCMKTNYLLNVSQRLGVPAQLLMLPVGEAELGINVCRRVATQGTEGGVKDHLVVSDQELNNERLIRVIHQRGKGNFGIRLPWFDQCWAKDDTQVAGCHLILLCLLHHPGERNDYCLYILFNNPDLFNVIFSLLNGLLHIEISKNKTHSPTCKMMNLIMHSAEMCFMGNLSEAAVPVQMLYEELQCLVMSWW